MIDQQGYRKNVGIIIANRLNQVLFAKRLKQKDAWQFPQGGVQANETPKQAMYRELEEEVGLRTKQVELLAETENWLSYDLPPTFRRYHSKPLCIGQKQKWFLLRLLSADDSINLDYSNNPEFSDWRWVDYWYPADHVIEFKRDVYQKALASLEPYL